MVELNLEVSDFDTGKTHMLYLPDDCGGIDYSHDLQITDWDLEVPIGYLNDVRGVVAFFKSLKFLYPDMTNDIFKCIFEVSQEKSILSQRFIDKITTGDFMFEECVGIEDWAGRIEARCARYLVSELHVPFAKNVTLKIMKNMADLAEDPMKSPIWNTVWRYYKKMGFRIIETSGKAYVFNWKDAVCI